MKFEATEERNGWIYINLTPHNIVLNDGQVFPPSGWVARVDAEFTDVSADLVFQRLGGLRIVKTEADKTKKPEEAAFPEEAYGTRYIVSGMVLSHSDMEIRSDVVAPATGHPQVVRENGQPKSVPYFVVNGL